MAMNDLSSHSRLTIVLALMLAACPLGALAGEPDPKEMAALAEAAKKLPKDFNKRLFQQMGRGRCAAPDKPCEEGE
jgi:hypothetical protein